MSEEQTPITEERLKEIEDRLKRLPGKDWYAEEDEHSWQLFAESETIFRGPLGPISGHPWQLIKAPKKDTPYAEYWPTTAVSTFITNARQDVPDLLTEIHRLRADLAASRRINLQARRKFMDAIAHPEQYTRLRAELLANEAAFAEADRIARKNAGTGEAPADSNQGEGRQTS